MRIVRPAPAKVNLALHVVGQRADGYHLLDTLVTFAATGDIIGAEIADALTLTVSGPFAGAIDTELAENLVMRAADLMAREVKPIGLPRRGARLTLTKNLPIASGLGGGSADAAATLIVLNELWRLDLTDVRLAEIGLQLGADVPMCLHGTPSRVTGIGEQVVPVPRMPDLGLLLVNPLVPVATPHVFRGLTKRDNPPMPDLPSAWVDLDHLVDWLRPTRNDLTDAAITIAPDIGEALAMLRGLPDCRFASMSGSGATCFGIFADDAAAQAAAEIIREKRPGWWVG